MTSPSLAWLILVQAAGPQDPGLPLVFQEDFREGEKALSRFEPTDPRAWKVVKDGDRFVLSQFQKSQYSPPVRSPLNIAWIRDLEVGPFEMEVKLRSTVKDYGHRDLCLFFGGVDSSRFFYVHLGKTADPHSHSIFLVDGRPRVSVATRRTAGAPWTDGYHTVRIARKESGETEVFWDGKSIMLAEERSFPRGRLGVGSFDDTGNFASITVWGKKASAGALERVVLGRDGRGFVLEPSGGRFVPWGFNYDHDQKDRLLEDYWESEWSKVEEDLPVVVEETFPLRSGAAEFRRFLERSADHASGWIGFYWGKSIEECRASGTIAYALLVAWLERFREGHPPGVR